MAEIVKIAELKIDNKALLTSLQATKKTIEALSNSQKRLKESGDTTSDTFIKQEAKLKTLKTEYTAQVKVLQAVTSGNKNLTSELEKEIKTVDQAKANNKQLVAIRNQVNTTTKEGKAQITAINKKMDDNNKTIKNNVSGLEKQKIGIGNYAKGLAGTNPILAQMSTVLGAVRNDLVAKNAAMKAATATTGNGSKALRIFKIALASTGVGLLIVALGSLVTFLASTQKGMDLITTVTRPLQAIFQSMVGVVQNLGSSLFDAFSNPKEALLSLGDLVKNNLINRFKAFGVILDGILTLDFKKVGNGVIQLGTGVEGLTGKIKEGAKQTAEFLKESAARGAEIDQLTKNIEQSENNLLLIRAKNTKEIKDQELIAKDASRTLVERNAAANKASELSKQISESELALIDKKIKLKETENSLNDTSRADEKELNELKAARYKAEEAATARELKFISVKSAVSKEAEAVQKAAQEKLDSEKTEADVAEIERLKLLSEEKVLIAQFELNDYIRNNMSKLDNDKFFSDESLRIEQTRLEELAQQRRDFAALQLEEGVLSKIEYDNAIKVIDDENRAVQDEAKLARKEAQAEADAIDLENKMAIEEELFENEFELASERLEQQRLRDVEAAEASGADIDLINQKYKVQQGIIDDEVADKKLDAVSNSLGQVAGLLGEHTVASKAAGIAAATINTYQGMTEVWKAPSVLPEPFNTATKVVGSATTLASGLASVNKIKNVKKAARGMLLTGASHAQGGIDVDTPQGKVEMEGGEAVINKESTRRFLPILSQINQAGGGVKFENGGIVGSTSSNPSSGMIDYDMLAASMATANASLPAPIVSVEEISSVTSRVGVIEANSTF